MNATYGPNSGQSADSNAGAADIGHAVLTLSKAVSTAAFELNAGQDACAEQLRFIGEMLEHHNREGLGDIAKAIRYHAEAIDRLAHALGGER